MTLSEITNKKKAIGFSFVMLIGLISVVIILSLLPSVFAVNQTAIDEIQTALESEIEYPNTFNVFWVIFLLIALALSMTVSFRMREDREMFAFGIMATIFSILLMLVFTSPLDFDYRETTNNLIVTEIVHTDGNVTYNSEVRNTVKQVIVIPADNEFRLAMSVLFTGVMIFNGLFSIFIVTNFNLKGASYFGKGKR